VHGQLGHALRAGDDARIRRELERRLVVAILEACQYFLSRPATSSSIRLSAIWTSVDRK
jgi:hypothetical protein